MKDVAVFSLRTDLYKETKNVVQIRLCFRLKKRSEGCGRRFTEYLCERYVSEKHLKQYRKQVKMMIENRRE